MQILDSNYLPLRRAPLYPAELRKRLIGGVIHNAPDYFGSYQLTPILFYHSHVENSTKFRTVCKNFDISHYL